MRISGTEIAALVQLPQGKESKAETGELFGMLMQALMQNDAVTEQTAALTSLCLSGTKAELEDEKGALLLDHVLALLSQQTASPAVSESIDFEEMGTLSAVTVSAATMIEADKDGAVSKVDKTPLPVSIVTEGAIPGHGDEPLMKVDTSQEEASVPALQALSAADGVPEVAPQRLAATPAASRAHAALSEAVPEVTRRPMLTENSGPTPVGTEGMPSGRGASFNALPPISSPSAAMLRAEILSFSQAPGRSNIELVVTPAGYGRVSVSAQEHPDNRVTVRLVVENAQVKEAITAQLPRLVNISGNVTVEVRTRAEAQEAEPGKNDGRSRGGQDQQPQRRTRNETKFEMQGVSDASR